MLFIILGEDKNLLDEKNKLLEELTEEAGEIYKKKVWIELCLTIPH